MTRAAFLKHLADKGYQVQPYRLDYLISTGQLARPQLDASGNRVFERKHLKQVIRVEDARLKEEAR